MITIFPKGKNEVYRSGKGPFQLALREYVTGLNFDDLLEKKEAIVNYVLEKVAAEADSLGVKVAGFGIREISERSEANEPGGAWRSSSDEVLCRVM